MAHQVRPGRRALGLPGGARRTRRGRARRHPRAPRAPRRSLCRSPRQAKARSFHCPVAALRLFLYSPFTGLSLLSSLPFRCPLPGLSLPCHRPFAVLPMPPQSIRANSGSSWRRTTTTTRTTWRGAGVAAEGCSAGRSGCTGMCCGWTRWRRREMATRWRRAVIGWPRSAQMRQLCACCAREPCAEKMERAEAERASCGMNALSSNSESKGFPSKFPSTKLMGMVEPQSVVIDRMYGLVHAFTQSVRAVNIRASPTAKAALGRTVDRASEAVRGRRRGRRCRAEDGVERRSASSRMWTAVAVAVLVAERCGARSWSARPGDVHVRLGVCVRRSNRDWPMAARYQRLRW